MNEGSSRPELFLDSLIILILVLIIGFRNVVVSGMYLKEIYKGLRQN